LQIVSLFLEEEKTLTVKHLVGDKPEEIIDLSYIKELSSRSFNWASDRDAPINLLFGS